MRGDYYLYFESSENVTYFSVEYAFPPEYGYQVPIVIEIKDDTTATIVDYKIKNDVNEPNKVVNFTVYKITKGERELIHFNYWVLVNNYDYSDLPANIPIPKKVDLPNETLKWLSATKVVQKDNFRIKLRAFQMMLLTSNVLKLANRIATFSKIHKHFLFLIQYWLGLYGPQDALTVLKRNGECPGRSHLGCALFRANDIPARVLITSPSLAIWYEAHYMMEYYSGQEYGWILTEVHNAKTPHEPKNQIILRICYPEDENNTQTDFVNKRMTGVESFLWIDNESVKPYYKDLAEGSKTRMDEEQSIIADAIIVNDVVNLTKEVYHKYEYYLGLSLSGEDIGYFDNATEYQMEAINGLKGSTHSLAYYYIYLVKAIEEFDKITS